MRNIKKKTITLGSKQFVPMFEQFLNESEEMEEEEDDDSHMHHDGSADYGKESEDEEVESEEGEDSMEGAEEDDMEEKEEEEEEIEERIQEAFKRGFAKGKRSVRRINEAADAVAVNSIVNSMLSTVKTARPALSFKMDSTGLESNATQIEFSVIMGANKNAKFKMGLSNLEGNPNPESVARTAVSMGDGGEVNVPAGTLFGHILLCASDSKLQIEPTVTTNRNADLLIKGLVEKFPNILTAKV
jgi:hypothetical protein